MASIQIDLPVTTSSPPVGGATSANQLTEITALQSIDSKTVGKNTNGSVINGALTATTASTENPPTNAVGFILMAPSTNADPVRFRIGGAASTTAGVYMESGRDSGYIPCAANISICATANNGTNKYEILWVLSA